MASSRCGTAETNPTRNMRLQVRSLASLRGLRIWSCCGCGVGQQLYVAPIRPLVWEPPYAVGLALKSKKKKRKLANQNVPAPTKCSLTMYQIHFSFCSHPSSPGIMSHLDCFKPPGPPLWSQGCLSELQITDPILCT